MNTNIEENIEEKIKLDRAYMNYHKIIDKKLPYKFSYLDEWTLKKSKKLLQETEQIENKENVKYRVYKRGTLIKVDFGVGLGSEMSQVHFAIVLNNYDNTKNNVLTVVPLTSKDGKFNLDLQGLVINQLIKRVEKEIIDIGMKEEHNKIKNSIDEAKFQKLNTLLSYYKNNAKNTYACCSLITTISKTKIILPINEYDIIGRVRCSNEVMDKIDKEIVDKFTKIMN